MERTGDRLIKAENEITIEEDLWKNSLDGSQYFQTRKDEDKKIPAIEGKNSNCCLVMYAKIIYYQYIRFQTFLNVSLKFRVIYCIIIKHCYVMV